MERKYWIGLCIKELVLGCVEGIRMFQDREDAHEPPFSSESKKYRNQLSDN
jgi:hypothetical protein